MNIQRREKMKGRNLYNLIGDLICYVLGLGQSIVGIFLLAYSHWYFGSILVVSGIISFVLPIAEYTWTKRTKRNELKSAEENEKIDFNDLPDGYILTEEELQRIDEWWDMSTPTRQKAYEENIKLAKLNKQQENQIKLMEYHKDTNTLTCAICKLKFRVEHRVLQCPICLSLFHSKHLIPWLKSTQKCPVCNQQILQQ